MLFNLLDKAKNIILSLSTFFLSLLPGTSTLTPTPIPVVEIQQVATAEAELSQNITASPSATTKPTQRPSPTPTAKIDLHLEKVTATEIQGKCIVSSNSRNLIARAIAIDPIEELQQQQKRNSCLVQSNSLIEFSGGSNPQFIISVRNNSQVEAKNVTVKLIIDREAQWSGTIESIPSGTSKTIRTDTSIPKTTGKHAVEIQVNPDKAFIETRYDNNTFNAEYLFQQ